MSDDSIQKLRFFFPDDLFLAALDLVDREKGKVFLLFHKNAFFTQYTTVTPTVIQMKTTWGRTFYEVHGTISTYAVTPQMYRGSLLDSSWNLARAFCSCSAFMFAVLLMEEQLMVSLSVLPVATISDERSLFFSSFFSFPFLTRLLIF